MRRRAMAAAGAVGAATAVTALVLGTVTGHAQSGTSSAYGFAAEGDFEQEPTPFVESTDGSLQEDSEAEIPLDDHGHIRLAEVSAEEDKANSTLADVTLESDEGGLQADVIDVRCEGSERNVSIAALSAGGEDLIGHGDLSPEPNQAILPEESPITVIANRQYETDEGDFVVEGLYVDLGDGQQTFTFGSATCGGPAAQEPEDPEKPDPEESPAPKPTPVETQLPVTG